MSTARSPAAYLMDMDGVLVRGAHLITGADAFIECLRRRSIRFLILTNNSRYTPRDLQLRLDYTGLHVSAQELFTSALATAQFLRDQTPNGTAYVVGEAGLTTALHDVGYVITDIRPDYVVLGETTTYSYQQLTAAMRLVVASARFIATNPDVNGPREDGLAPATGALAALLAAASGVKPYFIGKPNPLMMRAALRRLAAHTEGSVMIGDRMDTDIAAGTEAGMRTILVLTGVTRREDVARYPYRPTRIVESVAEVEPDAEMEHDRESETEPQIWPSPALSSLSSNMGTISAHSWFPSRPQIQKLGRQHMFEILYLSLADVLRQYCEHGPNDPLRIDEGAELYLLLDARQELFFMAYPQRLAGWIPRFVVEATDEHRQLRAKLRHLLYRESVAQGMEGRSQGSIGSVPILLPAQHQHQVLEPAVGFLDCGVEYFEARRAHRIVSCFLPQRLGMLRPQQPDRRTSGEALSCSQRADSASSNARFT